PPGPWLATATQFAPIVADCATAEQRAQLLALVADGATTGALAISEGAALLSTVRTVATRDGDGWRLSGRKQDVVDGSTADEIAVVGGVDEPSDRRLAVLVVARSDVEAEQVDSL